MQTLSCMCLSWGSHKTTFIYPQRGALITLLEQCTPCCYSHLSNRQGVSLIFFSDFASLLAKIPSSKFINLLQNSPLLVDFFSDFTIFAPCTSLFPPPSVSIEQRRQQRPLNKALYLLQTYFRISLQPIFNLSSFFFNIFLSFKLCNFLVRMHSHQHFNI